MAIQAPQPYNRGVAITTSDTVNFDGTTYSASPATAPIPCDALYVGGAGVVEAVFPDGSVVAFTAVAGELLPLRLIRVNDTNSTATLMVALYLV